MYCVAPRDVLGASSYREAVCIEMEDLAYEGSLGDRRWSLRQSKRFLEQWI
jgi:hypothetical protein